MSPVDPTDHPGDYIDRSMCMLSFLTVVISEQRSQMELPQSAQDGLCMILSHIEDNLKEALTLL